MADNKGLDPDILVCLKQIILIMKEDDLSEVCIEQKDMKIKVKRMSHLIRYTMFVLSPPT